MTSELKITDDDTLRGPGSVSPSSNLHLRSGLCTTMLPAEGPLLNHATPYQKLEVNAIQNVGIGSGFKGEKIVKIEMGGKYIRRGDIGDDGQPKPGVKPVTVLFPQLSTGCFLYETIHGDIVRVFDDGRYGFNIDCKKDLLQWPEPPKIVPWDCLDDIPLDAWFRHGVSIVWHRIAELDPRPSTSAAIKIGDQWTPYSTLFCEWSWTDNPKIMGSVNPCGKVAT